MAAAVDLPPGYYVEWGGQFENQQRAAARLAVVVPVSLGLIFLLLFSTFGSVRQALLVLTNIPLALVGGVLALFITGEYLSVQPGPVTTCPSKSRYRTRSAPGRLWRLNATAGSSAPGQSGARW